MKSARFALVFGYSTFAAALLGVVLQAIAMAPIFSNNTVGRYFLFASYFFFYATVCIVILVGRFLHGKRVSMSPALWSLSPKEEVLLNAPDERLELLPLNETP
jgi:hypothetical protein